MGSGTPGSGNFLRGDGAWTAISGAQITGYAATLADVTNTTTETTICYFDVGANEWADGDIIFLWLGNKLKNNSGSTRTTVGKVNVGAGAQVQILSQGFSDNASEFETMGMITSFMRTASTVMVGHNVRTWDVPTGAIYPNGEGAVGTSTPANFTDVQRVSFKVTLAHADSTYYVQPQNARVWKVSAT